jgi:tRNA threonylcarbamoyladenosine biosynthesis protein TsaE
LKRGELADSLVFYTAIGMEMTIRFSLDELREAARQFLDLKGTHQVIALHAPMGAGKTTFVHACCDVLQVKDAVGSPTYSIVNEYLSPTAGAIYHIDLYRLKDDEEAREAGIEDILYSGQLCFVEWPELAPGIFPDNTLHVRLEAFPDQTRSIAIS